MRDYLEKMSTEARQNKEMAKAQQTTWYDKRAREHSFEQGDQVLVVLPTSSSKLEAQWQGPYAVVERVGKVNYKLQMPDRRKKTAVFHMNMLQKWHTPVETGFLATETPQDTEDIPFWDDAGEGAAAGGNHLTPQELNSLLQRYNTVFQDLPGHTTLAKHHIHTD
jgi:hypothetical protein